MEKEKNVCTKAVTSAFKQELGEAVATNEQTTDLKGYLDIHGLFMENVVGINKRPTSTHPRYLPYYCCDIRRRSCSNLYTRHLCIFGCQSE